MSPVCAGISLACVKGTKLTKQAAIRITAVGTTAMNIRNPRVSGCRKPTYRDVYTAPDKPAPQHNRHSTGAFPQVCKYQYDFPMVLHPGRAFPLTLV